MVLVLVPVGGVVGADLQGSGEAVEQHTTYVELIVDDGRDVPGFAAVAGLVSCERTSTIQNAVLWFNDHVLFREGRRGPNTDCLTDDEQTHVWATEEGAPDPRGNPSLAATGKVFEFTDPNGIEWEVHEFVYHQLHVHREESTRVTAAGHTAGYDAEGEVRAIPYYTWVVEVQQATLDPTIVEHYNFVTVVDFDKLQHGPDGRDVHTGEDTAPRDGRSHNASDPDERHRLPHAHDTVDVHMWVGGAPEEGPGEPYEQGARVEPKVITPDNIV